MLIVATEATGGRVLWCERADFPGSWQLPQGGIRAGEDPVAAARREAREELGVEAWDVVDVMPGRVRYDFPPGVTKKGYHGQEQAVVLLRRAAAGTAAMLDPAAVAKPEFARCRWVAFGDVDLDEVPAFKRDAVARALEWARRTLQGAGESASGEE